MIYFYYQKKLLIRNFDVIISGALKIIATFSVGYDHLHLDEIKKRGIRIGIVGDKKLSEAVAEFNLGLAIAASRQFQQSKNFITW